MIKEVWKKIPGYSSYSVSNLGRVRRDIRAKNSRIQFGILREHKSQRYTSVTLTENDRSIKAGVHVLILMTFVGPKPIGTQACHIDDVRRNNTLENLKWGTPKENQADSIRNGGKYIAARKAREMMIRNRTLVGLAALSDRRKNLAISRSVKTKNKLGLYKDIGVKVSKAVKEYWKGISKEERSLFASKNQMARKRNGTPIGWQLWSDEKRSALAKKAWITRRKNLELRSTGA